MTAQAKVVTIYTESSPNPNSLKFVLNFYLLQNISLDYPSKEEAKESPLAVALFDNFDFIDGVFLAANFITISKKDGTDWHEVIPSVKEFIKQYILEERPVFSDAIEDKVKEEEKEEEFMSKPSTPEGELDKRIIAVLDEYVRPAVENDGGAITFDSFKEGVVKVRLQGACSGCPSSTVTLKNGIENLLKRMVPEVQEVVAV